MAVLSQGSVLYVGKPEHDPRPEKHLDGKQVKGDNFSYSAGCKAPSTPPRYRHRCPHEQGVYRTSAQGDHGVYAPKPHTKDAVVPPTHAVVRGDGDIQDRSKARISRGVHFDSSAPTEMGPSYKKITPGTASTVSTADKAEKREANGMGSSGAAHRNTMVSKDDNKAPVAVESQAQAQADTGKPHPLSVTRPRRTFLCGAFPRRSKSHVSAPSDLAKDAEKAILAQVDTRSSVHSVVKPGHKSSSTSSIISGRGTKTCPSALAIDAEGLALAEEAEEAATKKKTLRERLRSIATPLKRAGHKVAHWWDEEVMYTPPPPPPQVPLPLPTTRPPPQAPLPLSTTRPPPQAPLPLQTRLPQRSADPDDFSTAGGLLRSHYGSIPDVHRKQHLASKEALTTDALYQDQVQANERRQKQNGWKSRGQDEPVWDPHSRRIVRRDDGDGWQWDPVPRVVREEQEAEASKLEAKVVAAEMEQPKESKKTKPTRVAPRATGTAPGSIAAPGTQPSSGAAVEPSPSPKRSSLEKAAAHHFAFPAFTTSLPELASWQSEVNKDKSATAIEKARKRYIEAFEFFNAMPEEQKKLCFLPKIGGVPLEYSDKWFDATNRCVRMAKLADWE